MPRITTRSYILALVTLVILLYLPSVSFEFTYDDDLAIVGNPLVTAPERSLGNIGEIFSTPYRPGPLYRPITVLSYRLNALLTGMDPAAFHLTNIALHAGSSLLVFLLLRGYFAPAAAFVGAALFGLHPLAVEAVASTVGRAEILAAIFSLVYVLLFSRRRSFVLMFLSLFLGALSKESALSAVALGPIYLIAIDRKMGEKTDAKELIVRSIPGFAASACYLLLRLYVLGDNFLVEQPQGVFSAANPLLGVSFKDRLVPSLEYLGRYINLILLPLHLSADYSLGEDLFWAQSYSWLGLSWLKIFALFVMLLFLARKSPWALFGIWFLAAFSLTCNFVTPIGTIFGERLAYLPMIGMIGFGLGGWLAFCRRFQVRNVISIPFAVGILSLLFIRSHFRISVWENNGRLFAQTVKDMPESPKANFNYGLYLFQNAKQLDESENYFRRAFRLMPTNLDSAKFLAEIFLRKRDWARAEYWCREALKLNPNQKDIQASLDALDKLKESILNSQ